MNKHSQMEENNNNDNNNNINYSISLWNPNPGRRSKKLTKTESAKASLINNPLFNTGRIDSDSGLPILRLTPNPHKRVKKKEISNEETLNTKLSNSVSEINDAFRNADTLRL